MSSQPDLISEIDHIALEEEGWGPSYFSGSGGVRFRRRYITAAQSCGVKGRVQFSAFAEQLLREQAKHIPFLLDGL